MPMTDDLQEQKDTKNSASFIMSAFSAGMKVIASLPWKTIFLTGLALSASVAAAQSDDLSRNIINAVCNDDSFEAWNTVPGGYVGYKGQRMFSHCKTNPKSENCKEAQETANRLKHYNPHKNEINNAFEVAKDKIAKLVHKNNPEIAKIYETLNETESNIFYRMIDDISELYYRYLIAGASKNGGVCGQHASKVIRRFLNANNKYDLEIKFQIVELADEAAKSRERSSVDMEMKDHAFVLVDSNIEDMTVTDDKEKVAENLFKIQGMLCDTHQQRSGEISKDNSGLYSASKDAKGRYSSDAGWDSIKIQTLSIDLSPILTLPEDARNFICNLISSIKVPLTISQKKVCGFFSSSEKADVERTTLENAARSMAAVEIK